MRAPTETVMAGGGANPVVESAAAGIGCEEALLVADWERALFLHFEVPVSLLQPQVPFELDLFDGQAWVSLVAFTMRGLRPARGGRLGRWLCAAVSVQRFLNLRTYVRQAGEPGIHFLAEWMSHPLCVPLGPVTYGLPYRWGRLALDHAHEHGRLQGRVTGRRTGGALAYAAEPVDRSWTFAPCPAGSLDAFLLERYAAFTRQGQRRRVFRIGHRPWPQARAGVQLREDSLLRRTMPWWPQARWAGGNYSPGVTGVWMGPPRRLACP